MPTTRCCAYDTQPALSCSETAILFAQTQSAVAAPWVPGRSLLQNGEPLNVFIKQLRQCRKLRDAEEKQCKALVRDRPCSARR